MILLNELFEFKEGFRVHWICVQLVCFQALGTLRAEMGVRALVSGPNPTEGSVSCSSVRSAKELSGKTCHGSSPAHA